VNCKYRFGTLFKVLTHCQCVAQSGGVCFTDQFTIGFPLLTELGFASSVKNGISSFNPGLVYVDNVATLPTLTEGFLFEIYTPKLKSDDQIYYEFGQCYEVGDAGLSTRFHKGQTQNQATFAFTTFVNPSHPDTVNFQTTPANNLSVGSVVSIAGTSLEATVLTILSPTQFQSNLLFSVNNPPSSGTLIPDNSQATCLY